MMKKTFRRSSLLAGVFVLIAGVAGCANTGEKSGAYVDDAWITTKVKSEMIANHEVKAHNINVDSTRGVVMLTGTAETEQESNKAAEIARGIKGVTAVENRIRVQ
jgi:hyperosmotically inducible protein